MMDWGPSPQARGNLAASAAGNAEQGSIPAGAGKPSQPWRLPCSRWVHPRRRGETLGLSLRSYWVQGPSPQARGNPTITSEPVNG